MEAWLIIKYATPLLATVLVGYSVRNLASPTRVQIWTFRMEPLIT